MRWEVVDCEKNAQKYPALMITDMGTIALFTSYDNGVVIRNSRGSSYDLLEKVGKDSGPFRPFHGKLILEEE